MSVEAIKKDAAQRMDKAIDHLKLEMRGIRTGRATPALVEHIKIEIQSYGSTMELREIATIGVPEPTTLMVKPFDPTTLKDIEKGLQKSSLNITPQSDGKVIRLPVPPLSGERRQQIIADVKKLGEQQKISVRNVRRDANKAIDAAEKDKTISEDEAKDAKDHIQKITKQHEEDIDEIIKAKSTELEQV